MPVQVKKLLDSIKDSVHRNISQIREVANENIDLFHDKMLEHQLIPSKSEKSFDTMLGNLINCLDLSNESEVELEKTCHKFLTVLLELGGSGTIRLSRDLRKEWKSMAESCGASSFLSKETLPAEENDMLKSMKVEPVKPEDNQPPGPRRPQVADQATRSRFSNADHHSHHQRRYDTHWDADNEAAKVFKSQYNEIVRILQNEHLTVKFADELSKCKIIPPSLREQFSSKFLQDGSIIQAKAVVGEICTVIERAVEPARQLKRVVNVLHKPEFYHHFKHVIKELSRNGLLPSPPTRRATASQATAQVQTQRTLDHLQSTVPSPDDNDLSQQPYMVYNKGNLPSDPCKRRLFLKYQNNLPPVDMVSGDSTNWKYYDLVTSTPEASKTRESGGPLNLRCIPLEETSRYPLHTLITGPPGVGKSSIVVELCKRWYSQQLLQDYEYVILVQADHRPINTLKDVIREDEVRSAIEDSGGENTLFIIDGYDEFNQSNREKIYYHIITGEILSEAAVIVTARPWCAKQLSRRFDTIEIQGFTRQSRQEYIHVHTSRSLRTKLCFPSSLEACTSNPFYLATMIKIFSTNDEDGQPKPFQLSAVDASFISITKLYWLLVQTLIYDFACKNIKSELQTSFRFFDSIVAECDFSSLPRNIYINFFNLCILAYKSLFIDKVNYLDLVVEPSNKAQPTFNLLTKRESDDQPPSGRARYIFRHPSLQEYLAAYCISRMDKQDQEKSIQSLLQHESFQQHDLVIEFLYGFGCIKNTVKLKKDYHDIHEFKLIRQLCEADNSVPLIKDVYRKEEREASGHDRYVSIFRTWPSPVPYDFLCLGRVIALSNCDWGLGFTIRPLQDEHIQLLCEGIKSATDLKPSELGRLKKIKFSLTKITEQGISHINNIPEPCLSSIDEIQLRGIGLTSTDQLCILLPKLPGLQNLFFHDNKFTPNQQMNLLHSLMRHCNQLKHIILSGVSPEECIQLLRFQSLEKIELWRISTDSCMALVENLISGAKLNTLEIHQTEVTKDVVKVLPHTLPKSKVTCLKLINCNIDCEMVDIIAGAIRSCMQQRDGREMSIDLSDNIIRNRGRDILLQLRDQEGCDILKSDNHNEFSMPWRTNYQNGRSYDHHRSQFRSQQQGHRRGHQGRGRYHQEGRY